MFESMLRRAYHRRLAASDRRRADGALEVYPFLNVVMLDALDEEPRLQPRYLWPVIHAMYLARQLGLPAIELVEFGTGSGDGAFLLARAAEVAGRRLSVEGRVATFDGGTGVPDTGDPRDMPHLNHPGDYSDFDVERIARKVSPARLVVGPFEETVPAWMESEREAPVGFAAFDTGHFLAASVAMDAMFRESPAEALLPRTHCYFNGVQQYSYGWCNGPLRAIGVHNDLEQHDEILTGWRRPLARLRGLEYDCVPAQLRHQRWVQEQYLLHVYDHARYCEPDGMLRGGVTVARQSDIPLPASVAGD